MSHLLGFSVCRFLPFLPSLTTAVAKWLGRSTSLDDLQSLDNELYKGLISECSAVRWGFN